MLKRRTAVELVERAPDLDESFLREVFQFLRVAFVTVQNSEHPRPMALDEFGEIVQRAVADAGQQFGIIIHRWLKFRFQLACH